LLLGYDTTPPQAREAEAKAIEAAMKAFVAQWEAADKAGDPSLRPSVEEYRARFRLPVATDQLAAANAAIRTLTAEQRSQLFAQMRAENDNSEALTVNGAPAITDVDPKETLNGAQIDSAVSIVSMVAAGELPRDAGIAQLEILLNLTNGQATRMMGSAGAGFVAAVDGNPPAPAAAPMPTAEPIQEAPKETEVPDEPGYSEKLAATMNEHGLSMCPHDQEKYCPSCRVVRRYEVQADKTYKPVWHSYAKAAA
jgi:hypothetical protein